MERTENGSELFKQSTTLIRGNEKWNQVPSAIKYLDEKFEQSNIQKTGSTRKLSLVNIFSDSFINSHSQFYISLGY